MQKKFYNICRYKKKPYLCIALENKALLKEFWRGGRVVDCGGLENRCTARYPGFESLSLRQVSLLKEISEGFFILSPYKDATSTALHLFIILRSTLLLNFHLSSIIHTILLMLILYPTLHNRLMSSSKVSRFMARARIADL